MNPNTPVNNSDFPHWSRQLIKKLYKNARNAGFLALVIGGMSVLILVLEILRYVLGNDRMFNILEMVYSITQLDFAHVYSFLLGPIDIVLGVFLLKAASHLDRALLSEGNESFHGRIVLKNLNRVFLAIYAQYILLIITFWAAILTERPWMGW